VKDENIRAIQDGNSKGLQNIYAEFLPRIRRLITNNGGREEDAQDVFQNAILVIYEKSAQKDFKLTSGFYTLLYGICRNLWGNRLQKKSFKEVTIPEDVKYKSDDNIEADLEAIEEQNLFWSAFKNLGEDCQKLMRLFFDKEKMEKIAQMMGYSSVSYAKKRKFQCKEKLVAFVKADDRFDELNNNN